MNARAEMKQAEIRHDRPPISRAATMEAGSIVLRPEAMLTRECSDVEQRSRRHTGTSFSCSTSKSLPTLPTGTSVYSIFLNTISLSTPLPRRFSVQLVVKHYFSSILFLPAAGIRFVNSIANMPPKISVAENNTAEYRRSEVSGHDGFSIDRSDKKGRATINRALAGAAIQKQQRGDRSLLRWSALQVGRLTTMLGRLVDHVTLEQR